MPRLSSGSILIEPSSLTLNTSLKLMEYLRGQVNTIKVLYRPGTANILIHGRVVALALAPFTVIIDKGDANELAALVERYGRVYVLAGDTWLDYVEISIEELLALLQALSNLSEVCTRSLCVTFTTMSGCERIVIADERLVYVAGLLGHKSTGIELSNLPRDRNVYAYCEVQGSRYPVVEALSWEDGKASYKVRVALEVVDVIQWILVGLLISAD